MDSDEIVYATVEEVIGKTGKSLSSKTDWRGAAQTAHTSLVWSHTSGYGALSGALACLWALSDKGVFVIVSRLKRRYHSS